MFSYDKSHNAPVISPYFLHLHYCTQTLPCLCDKPKHSTHTFLIYTKSPILSIYIICMPSNDYGYCMHFNEKRTVLAETWKQWNEITYTTLVVAKRTLRERWKHPFEKFTEWVRLIPSLLSNVLTLTYKSIRTPILNFVGPLKKRSFFTLRTRSNIDTLKSIQSLAWVRIGA